MSTAAGRCCWAGSPRDGALVTMTGGLAHGDGDIRVILAAQALRAAAYGFAAVLLGVGAASRGWSPRQVGVLLAAVVAGTALASVLVGVFAERLGRRRCYRLLYLGLAATGLAFGLTDRLWLLGLVALLGVLSTEVVESGPFTSLEQAMLAEAAPQPAAPRGPGPACSDCVAPPPRPPWSTGAGSCYWSRSGWPAPRLPDGSRAGSRRRRPQRTGLCQMGGIVGGRWSARAASCWRCQGCSRSTRSAAGSWCRASSPSGCVSGLACRWARWGCCSLRLGCCRPHPSWPPSAWPRGSACCQPLSSPTCRPTCCWLRSPSRPTPPWRSRCCWAGLRSARWTSPPGRPT